MSDLIQVGVAFVFGLGVGMIGAWVAREERAAAAWGRDLDEPSIYDWELEDRVTRDVKVRRL